MTKRCLASSAAVACLLLPSIASAQAQFVGQPDAPQWLKDRQFNEGAGIRTGDLELHPGIAGETGFDSNWFLRTSKTGFNNGPPSLPIIPAWEFRVTPSLYLATLGPQRKEEDIAPQLPGVAFRAGVNATYREFIGLSNASGPSNEISNQRNLGIAADTRLDILPEHPLGVGIFANYARVPQPNLGSADPNLSFTHDDINAGGEIVVQPGSGTLDWRFGYQFHDVIFEDAPGQPFDNIVHEAYTRGRWRFRPRTALIYDGSVRFLSYTNPDAALASEALLSSTPVRARIGLNGLITDRFALLGVVGWGASFYDTPAGYGAQSQYDSVIGQAELKWFLSAGPGIASPSDVGLALSSIALGYTRDFQNSYLGNYYGLDRGYLKFSYFFAGRALVSLEGGVGAVEYPNILWDSNPANDGGAKPGSLRQKAFTDARVDATLFSEYRFTDALGLNLTLRYTSNLSNTELPTLTNMVQSKEYDMSWSRFEAFVGLRYFL